MYHAWANLYVVIELFLQRLQVGCPQYVNRLGCQNQRVTDNTVTNVNSHLPLLHWTTNLQTSVLLGSMLRLVHDAISLSHSICTCGHWSTSSQGINHLLLPRYSVHFSLIFSNVSDTPAISNDVIRLPMYTRVTFICILSTVM